MTAELAKEEPITKFSRYSVVWLLALALGSVALAQEPQQVVITMSNGVTVQGIIVQHTSDAVRLRISFGEYEIIPTVRIRRIMLDGQDVTAQYLPDVIQSQPGLGQMTADSTSLDPGLSNHSFTKDVLVSFLFGAGGSGIGLLTENGEIFIGGWYAGTLLGTAIVHRDNHIYPSQLLAWAAGIFLGGLGVGFAVVPCILGTDCSEIVVIGAVALAMIGPAIGSTAGYHWGKRREEEKSRSANE